MEPYCPRVDVNILRPLDNRFVYLRPIFTSRYEYIRDTLRSNKHPKTAEFLTERTNRMREALSSIITIKIHLLSLRKTCHSQA